MEYQGTQMIQATPDQVFAFVSDVRNLPQYLPTTKRAEPQDGERVEVEGEAQGHHYHADGHFRQDPRNHRLEWGSDGEISYSGTLEVRSNGDSASEVTVRLRFEPDPQRAPNQDMPGQAPSDNQIQEGIDKALESIQNFVEGRGGKEEPSAAT
ncbi:SRPBCC family protein [Deinococcus apachensis]|uniref:SRPBCC family protein n=1 Tax=Deinococcus apachensis TaxID=309886 RepID=UPI00037FB50E|nr:SRPBCC family protein [Deinococcus apachensis]